ncbi:cytochrome P450 [Glonium stellatum]|uniref:Cytochrome P450 n=1 Tax=Glonium stellatum TaxID=574774 RepID=A0A8E2F3Z6_9PEZI|nr:cytochrome P450 [Glonium stellatum]
MSSHAKLSRFESLQRIWIQEPEQRTRFIALGVISLCFIKYICTIVYRLYFSPLAPFPGPKLAAATSLYEFYFDYFKKAKYYAEIERLHKVYGPIVRINPLELSISDPAFYDKVYVAGNVRPTENYSHFASGIGFEGTFFLSTAHDLHRKRRKPFEPYFSRLGVTKLEPIINEFVKKLIKRFDSFKGTGRVVRLDHAMLAYSGDVIGHICVDNPKELIEDENFTPEWYDLQHSMIKCMPLFTEFPWIIHIIKWIPSQILVWIDPKSECFNVWRASAKKHIEQVKSDKHRMPEEGTSNLGGRPTLFRYIVNNSGLAESDLSVDRLTKEAQILLGAGSVSTARTIHYIVFYLLSNEHMRKRLEEELKDAMAEWPEKKLTWAQLEKVLYLQALIKEGLRHSYGTMHRLPRVSPSAAFQYKEWTIPAGVPVGMTAYLQHTDPEVYPRPFEFIPERWLSNVTPQMTRSLVPFSRGSRNCIGMNLAYAEVNFMLAALFRPGGSGFELFETDESDVVAAHDYIVPLARLDSKGVRIIFR